MRAFRGLGDLPERMGMTLEEGQRVTDLPFAEGQLLSTLVDDWRRLRCEPAVLTWAIHHQNAPGALEQLYTLRPRRYPIAVMLMVADTDPPPATQSARVARITGNGLSFGGGTPVLNAKCLEGILVSQLSDTADQEFESDAQFRNHGGQPTIVNASAPVLQPATSPSMICWNRVLPLYLMPGQTLAWQAQIAATLLGMTVVWRQFPSMVDVLTSAGAAAATYGT